MAQTHDRASGLFADPSRSPSHRGTPATPAATPDPNSLSIGWDGFDPLSDVLGTVKLTGALFFLVDARCPWGIEVPRAETFGADVMPRAQHLVSYHIALDGSGWAGLADAALMPFEAGDVLIFAHGDAYSLTSHPDQPPEFDQEATSQFLRDMAAGKLPFVVREGGSGPERTRFACGYLGCDIRPFNPVLAALPPLLRIRRGADASGRMLDTLVKLTLKEAAVRRPGGDAIRLRLSELLFVEALRRHLAELPSGRHGWLSGLHDPHVGRAIAMLHKHPAAHWTLKVLAQATGLSRATLADRFARLVGCPPMHYLTLWRMQIAARRLADDHVKVSAAASDVGYESEAAFSRAFKKATGVSPSEWRSRQAPPARRC